MSFRTKRAVFTAATCVAVALHSVVPASAIDNPGDHLWSTDRVYATGNSTFTAPVPHINANTKQNTVRLWKKFWEQAPISNVPVVDSSRCSSAMPSARLMQQQVSALNNLRQMASLQPVELFAPDSRVYREVQANAISTAVTSAALKKLKISHHPVDDGYYCAGKDAERGGASSLSVASTNGSVDGINHLDGLVRDETKTDPGHRIQLLAYDFARTAVGAGTARNGWKYTTYAIRSLDGNNDGVSDTARERAYAFWPSAGYFPKEGMNMMAWSAQLPGVDLNNAKVEIQKPNGSRYAVDSFVSRSHLGKYGYDTLVFPAPDHNNPQSGTYVVSITTNDGQLTYPVTVFTSGVPVEKKPELTILGSTDGVNTIGNSSSDKEGKQDGTDAGSSGSSEQNLSTVLFVILMILSTVSKMPITIPIGG
ncbi:hypothetical protein ACFSSC_00650 [Corynebacterium mendelii]|uniref:SCP domain-containing protein n=1 Tax=Corynebacterium mendelii TaxID=2765362 RepID=A0A939DYX1_9CORY|nr:hypothetical protein [Corynebacterium mendelii]MBN9643795.1 hypothetical protein [Corynebacterium mendelii]